MLNEKDSRSIRRYEEIGVGIVDIDSEGKVVYSTQCGNINEYCDQCPSFRLFPDPDPYDWFRDGDLKAVCIEVNRVIRFGLESPSEFTKIRKPFYCPRLGRELSDSKKKK